MDMSQVPKLIRGSLFNDFRGSLTSCNDFDMADVRRMYYIAPSSVNIVRAWQAHKYEKKWFLCINGGFEIKLIKIDDFDNPSYKLPIFSYLLNANTPQILYIPSGYANGFKPTEGASRLLVFSNYTLTESNNDDYRYEPNYWGEWQN